MALMALREGRVLQKVEEPSGLHILQHIISIPARVTTKNKPIASL